MTGRARRGGESALAALSDPAGRGRPGGPVGCDAADGVS